jgi:hypothetical protein
MGGGMNGQAKGEVWCFMVTQLYGSKESAYVQHRTIIAVLLSHEISLTLIPRKASNPKYFV